MIELAYASFGKPAPGSMDRRTHAFVWLMSALAIAVRSADAIAAAAHAIADTLELGAIVCYTATGSTALRVARERPGVNVIGLTPIEQTAQRLSLVWGIQTILTSDPKDLADMVRKACRIPFDEGFVKAGQGLVITAGVPLGSPGATNMIRIAYLTEEGLPDGHTIKGQIRRAPGRRAQRQAGRVHVHVGAEADGQLLQHATAS